MKHYYFLLALLCFTLTSFSQVPPNDQIQNAVNVSISSLPFSDSNVQTQNATTASNGQLPCDPSATFTRVYYRFKPNRDMRLNVQLSNGVANSSFVTFYRSSVQNATSDFQLTLATGEACAFATSKTLSLTSNFVYYIVVGNPLNSTDVNFSEVPINDVIQNAVNITSIPFVDGDVLTQNATLASNGSWGNCSTASAKRIYYRYAPTQNKTVIVELSNGNANSFAIVFQSSVSNATSDTQIQLATAASCSNSTSTQYDFLAGIVYYILVSNPDNLTSISFYEPGTDNIINFPDANLKNALINTGCIYTYTYNLDNMVNSRFPFLSASYSGTNDADINNDGEIQEYEALLVSRLALNQQNISNLGGLEYFSNLQALDVQINIIDNLSPLYDLNLLHLVCHFNDLPSVMDFSENPELIILVCSDPDLTSVNVSQNVNLRSLIVSASPGLLSSVDISQNIQLETFWFGFAPVTTLDVSNNINLKNLWLALSQFSAIDISNNGELIDLDLAGNLMSYIDVNNNTLLENLNISNNQLSTIDISNNTLLEVINISGNGLSSINLDNNLNLSSLNISNNELTQIDVSNNLSLGTLRFDSNFIENLDVSNNLSLSAITFKNNLLLDLDLSANTNLISIDASNNYFLENLNIKNGNNQNINIDPFLIGLLATNCPNLQTICVDDIGYATANFTDKDPHTIFVEDCSSNSVNYNIIQGVLTFDENENGCDVGDVKIPNTLISATDGTNTFSTFTNSNGAYAIDVVQNTYTTSPVGLSGLYTATPSTVVDTFTAFGLTETADFCVTINQDVYDINVTVLPLNQARPGFEAFYRIVFENVGLTTNSGSVTFQFDDMMQTFLTATPSENASTSNSLTFNYTNLQPFEVRTIDVTLNTFAPPTVNSDDILNFVATVSPSVDDVTPEDNVFNLAQTVVNSYDPNDKQVLQGPEITIDEADEYLDYLIRFQNTGTASAINVVITDELNAKLDFNTIRPVSSSHDFTTRITNGDFVEFIFNNINLPAQQDDEAASNGFIAFKIKPKSNVAIGDIITGEAKIYFDFNSPIITNTVSTEIIETLGVPENTLADGLLIYPNPVSNILNIKLNNGVVLESLSLYSITGEELFKDPHPTQQFDMSNYASGVYFLKIETNHNVVNKRILKK